MERKLIDKDDAMFLVREKCLEIINRCADRYYDADAEDYKYESMDIFNAIIACKEDVPGEEVEA